MALYILRFTEFRTLLSLPTGITFASISAFQPNQTLITITTEIWTWLDCSGCSSQWEKPANFRNGGFWGFRSFLPSYLRILQPVWSTRISALRLLKPNPTALNLPASVNNPDQKGFWGFGSNKIFVSFGLGCCHNNCPESASDCEQPRSMMI